MNNPRPKRRWYQFTLRTLLVFVLICAIPCSWFAVKMNRARKQREVVEAIVEAGGRVIYDYEMLEMMPGGKPSVPRWLRDLLGDDFFGDIDTVTAMTPDFGDAEAEHINRLTNLWALNIEGSNVTDVGLKHLKGMTRLRELSVCGCSEATDVGVEYFKELTSLFYLGLADTQVTDTGLVHLKGLTNLRGLWLQRTQITDAGLVHLGGLTKLEQLDLTDTQVTPEGVKELQAALPDCDISH